jgi:hypothetical protein
MEKAEQKMTAKNLIQLGFNSETVTHFAENVLPGDKVSVVAIARKVETGQTPTEAELATLARFDAVIDARLDAAFERAEQKYRNTARVAAAFVAIVLGEFGAIIVYGNAGLGVLVLGFVVGLIAVPIAPVAKDLSSAISTAVNTFKAVQK